MSLGVAKETTHFHIARTIHLNNVLELLKTERPPQAIGGPFGLGFECGIQSQYNAAKKRHDIGLYISAVPGFLNLRGPHDVTAQFALKLRSHTLVAFCINETLSHESPLIGIHGLLNDARHARLIEALKKEDCLEVFVSLESNPQKQSIVNDRIPRITANSIGRLISIEKDERDVKFVLYKSLPVMEAKKIALGIVYASSRAIQPIEDYLNEHYICQDEDKPFDDLEYSEMPFFAEHYDYLEDSDLEFFDAREMSPYEDEISGSINGDELKDLLEEAATYLKSPPKQTQTMQVELNHPQDENRQPSPSTSDQNMETDDTTVHSKGKHLKSDDTSSESSTSEDRIACRVVMIPDIAYKTWLAVIFYLYTGIIHFAPLSSDPDVDYDVVNARHLSFLPHCPSLVSCKSIFQVADKLGLDNLQELAINHLESQLSARNIVSEIFSLFISRHDTLKDIEADFLFNKLPDLKNVPGLSQKIKEVASGKHPHSTWILDRMMIMR